MRAGDLAAALMVFAIAAPAAHAQDTDSAKAAAIALVRAELGKAAPAGELIAGPSEPVMEAVLALPADSASAAEVSNDGVTTAAVPAPRDPVANRVALAFAVLSPGGAVAASESARPEDHAVVAALPGHTALALAYAPAPEDNGGKRPTHALSAIEALVEKHAEAYDVPVDLALALVQVESSYNPKATGRNGEIGLLQISPKTARGIGYKGDTKALYDPDTNLTWGMKYLGKAQKLAGGDICGTLLRYNAGLDAKRMNSASSKFCAKVKSVMEKRA